MANAGTVLRREEIMDEVWDPHWFGPTKTLDVHISWLRKKIEDDPTHPEVHRNGTGRRLPFRRSGPTMRRKRTSLRSRLVWSITYILLAVIVALTIPLAINLARRGTTELATDTLITAQTLGAYVGAENLDDPQALARIGHAAPEEIERVIVTDADGTVLYDSTGVSTGREFANGLRPEIDAALQGDPNAEIRYSDTDHQTTSTPRLRSSTRSRSSARSA